MNHDFVLYWFGHLHYWWHRYLDCRFQGQCLVVFGLFNLFTHQFAVFIFALARCQKSLFLTNTGLRTDFAGQRFEPTSLNHAFQYHHTPNKRSVNLTGRFLTPKITQALNVTHGLNFATPCIKPAASCAAMTGCTSL